MTIIQEKQAIASGLIPATMFGLPYVIEREYGGRRLHIYERIVGSESIRIELIEPLPDFDTPYQIIIYWMSRNVPIAASNTLMSSSLEEVYNLAKEEIREIAKRKYHEKQSIKESNDI